jgi:hypothetical protein
MRGRLQDGSASKPRLTRNRAITSDDRTQEIERGEDFAWMVYGDSREPLKSPAFESVSVAKKFRA